MKRAGIILALLLIIGSVAAVYVPSINNGFTNYDDDVLVYENSLIKDGGRDSASGIWARSYFGMYHPLVLVSYALEYRFFGLEAGAYHRTNVILHLLNCLLVFWLFRLLTRNTLVAGLVALLFGLHPMHVESVAWISERKDVLYAFFFLWSCVTYVYYLKRNDAGFFLGSLVCFALALLSKFMAVSLPFVLLLLDFYRGRRLRPLVVLEKLPFFILAAVFGVIALSSHYGSNEARHVFRLSDGIVNGFSGFIFYLAKLVAPTRLSCLYPFTAGHWNEFFVVGLVPFVLAGILAFVTYFSRRYTKIVLFGMLMYAVMIFPVLQFVPVGQGIPADRYTYLPSLGLFFIAAGLSMKIFLRTGVLVRTITVAGWVGILAAASLSARAQTMIWKDSMTLWNACIERYPDVARAYKIRGDAYKSKGEYAKAFADYDAALSRDPGLLEAYVNRGNLHSYLGQNDAALEEYSAALRINPDYIHALYNRGLIYRQMGRYADAVADSDRALARDSRNPQLYNNRGVAYAKLNQIERALKDFNKALSLDPRLNEALANRAYSFFLTRQYDKAWDDITELRSRGVQVNQDFMKKVYPLIGKNRELPL